MAVHRFLVVWDRVTATTTVTYTAATAATHAGAASFATTHARCLCCSSAARYHPAFYRFEPPAGYDGGLYLPRITTPCVQDALPHRA